MIIRSGDITKYIYFVALLAGTRITGLFGASPATHKVYRSGNGVAEVLYTTPTIVEIDPTNTPGVYALLVDEDTIIAAGSLEEEMALHITETGMDDVTRVVQIREDGIISNTAKTGTLSSTQMSTNLTGATDDALIDKVFIWTSGVLKGQMSQITDYVGDNGVLFLYR